MNRLAHETSPYLLQHADNPVDWYPWGDEAFAKAGAEDRPILLSIGYAACHWCHVMEHESFEDEDTARLMNEHFVSVKVDREERPDVDGLYMDAVVGMTGHGGWPMTVFLTPDGRPFFGGTYFPPEPRFNMPSFRQVLLAVAEAYRTRRDDLERQGDALVEAIQSGSAQPPSTEPLTTELLTQRRLRTRDSSSTRCRAASAARRSSRLPPRSSCSSAPAGPTRSRWCGSRSTAWPRAACTTFSEAVSIATPSTQRGSCPTSRRCSTTTRSWRARTCTRGSSAGEERYRAVAEETLDYAPPRPPPSRKEGSPPPRTRTRTGSRA